MQKKKNLFPNSSELDFLVDFFFFKHSEEKEQGVESIYSVLAFQISTGKNLHA